jgi:rare lipoprotein A
VLIRSDSTTATIWRQTGIASWYGGARWQGNRTASGARYDQNQLTAAHATLPLGTKVRVTLEGTNRSVVVLINDRPGTRRRIIDLSRSAAAELGILKQGVAVVTLSAL